MKKKTLFSIVVGVALFILVLLGFAAYFGSLETAAASELPCISVTWGFRDREYLVAEGAEIFADTPPEVVERIADF